MESFNLDISLDYTEEFNFGSRLSSASSARSFSTASSRAPITPQSGRSTPQQCVPSMSLKSLAEYEFTSPNNSMDDYFSTDIKGEFPVCDIISLTPAKKTTASQYTMDVDQTTFMTPNPSSYGNVMDFNPQSFLEPLPFSDPMNLSPFAGSSTPYSINDHPGNSPSLWSCQFENPLEYLTRTESPAFTSPLGDYALQDRSTPLPSSHPRRSASMQNTRDKTSLSHQVQSDPRDLKQPSCLELEQLGIKTEEPGKFACDMPKCIKQAKKYQRMEHLKRHWNK